MPEPSQRFIHFCFILIFLSMFTQGALSHAQTPPQPADDGRAPDSDPDRKQAVEFMGSGKMAQAMPLFEKLCSEYPKDAGMWEGWDTSTLSYAQTLSDPNLRKKARARGRAFLVKARELGDNSNLVQTMLGMIPEDGGDLTYSPHKEVDDAMQQAEAEFVKGNYDNARDSYLHVLLLDPKNYEAALFIGDTYFKQRNHTSAGEWFARAIEIDPNRETAYRYWGESLLVNGKNAESREKFIQAVVADPFNNRSWMGLNQWAQHAKVNLNWVRLQDKGSVTQKDDQHINITIDPTSLKKDDPAGPAWLAYSMNRALWKGDKFKKEFPNEPAYHHTLKEEVDSLNMLVNVITEQRDFEKKKKDLDPALVQLIQIDKAGFIEPFALLNRADKDIAQDYAPYRDAHRDTIYRYFDEYVVPKAPAQ